MVGVHEIVYQVFAQSLKVSCNQPTIFSSPGSGARIINNIINGLAWNTGRKIGAKLMSNNFPEDIMMKATSRLRIAVVFAAVFALLLGPVNSALAADEAIGFGKESFKLNLGYYQPNFNSRVAVGTTGSTPGDISGEEDLGLDNSLGGARLDGYWRFANRHRLHFGYYVLDRSASRVLTKDIGPIDIPGLGVYETIKAGSNIHTEAKWEIFMLGYGYSFYKSETLEVAGQFGLNVGQIGTKISGTFITDPSYPSPGVSGATAGSVHYVPLPAIGFSGDWALDDRWRIRGHAGAFKIKIQNVEANVLDAGVAGEYRVYGNIWGGLGYSVLNASAKLTETNSNASIDWRTGGLQLYGSILF
jgi:hypothetical protein